MTKEAFATDFAALVRAILAEQDSQFAPVDVMEDGIDELWEALNQVRMNIEDGDKLEAIVFNLATVAALAQRACHPLVAHLVPGEVLALIEEFGEVAR